MSEYLLLSSGYSNTTNIRYSKKFLLGIFEKYRSGFLLCRLPGLPESPSIDDAKTCGTITDMRIERDDSSVKLYGKIKPSGPMSGFFTESNTPPSINIRANVRIGTVKGLNIALDVLGFTVTPSANEGE